MEEHEFDSLREWRPFGTQEAGAAAARMGQCATLAVALWGTTREDLEQRLRARTPVITAGDEPADLWALYDQARKLAAAFENPANTWLPQHLRDGSAMIVVGAERFTAWQARCEIVRRAIEFLEDS